MFNNSDNFEWPQDDMMCQFSKTSLVARRIGPVKEKQNKFADEVVRIPSVKYAGAAK